MTASSRVIEIVIRYRPKPLRAGSLHAGSSASH
jgi:hypothetical protein